MVLGCFRILIVYCLIVLSSSKAASRVLLERDRGQEYGALVGSARRLAAEPTQTGTTIDRKGAEEAGGLTQEYVVVRTTFRPGLVCSRSRRMHANMQELTVK